MSKSNRSLWAFLVLTCLLSWPIWVLSVLFTWFYLRAKGSLLIALLLHTSLNVMGDLGLSNFERTGMFFFVVMAIAAVIVSVQSPVFRAD